MRLLYFSPRDCWPVTTGARLRDFHLACQLAKHATITYLGFGTGLNSIRRERLEPLENSEVVLVPRNGGYAPLDLVRGFIGPEPISVLNYRTPAMLAELERLLRESPFDAIQIEGVHLAAYLDPIRRLAPKTRLVSDWHNIESELMERFAENERNPARRLYAIRTATLLRRMEDRLLKSCDAHTVCSERERALLLARNAGAHIEVVGNGVDTAYFAESAASPSTPRRNIVFVGSMDYHANIDAAIWFAAEIWPMIRTRRPGLEFQIVGSRPVDAVRALDSRDGVTVTGTVEDVRPYYAGAVAVVTPLRVGSGTRLKVLEAMAAGVPVVSTTLGVEGLAVRDGENVLIGDSAATIAERICMLEAGSPEWRSIADAGRQLVTSRYDWSIIGQTLVRLYTE